MLDDFIYVLTNYNHWLWEGLGLTLQLLVLSVIGGTALALPIALARTSKNPWINLPSFGYVYVLRGTPLLCQLFLIYYGLGQFEAVRTSFLWPMLRDPWWCCLLAFCLNTSAYVAEIMRGGIQNVPRGEVEAGIACGMSKLVLFRRIILPRMWRIIWPAYTNDIIFTMKATALASTVTLMELTGAARKIVARTALPYEAFLTAAALYLIVTYGLTLLFKAVETYLRRSEQPQDGGKAQRA
jgi:octopine/nopaline transport system permease protein